MHSVVWTEAQAIPARYIDNVIISSAAMQKTCKIIPLNTTQLGRKDSIKGIHWLFGRERKHPTSNKQCFPHPRPLLVRLHTNQLFMLHKALPVYSRNTSQFCWPFSTHCIQRLGLPPPCMFPLLHHHHHRHHAGCTSSQAPSCHLFAIIVFCYLSSHSKVISKEHAQRHIKTRPSIANKHTDGPHVQMKAEEQQAIYAAAGC